MDKKISKKGPNKTIMDVETKTISESNPKIILPAPDIKVLSDGGTSTFEANITTISEEKTKEIEVHEVEERKQGKK